MSDITDKFRSNIGVLMRFEGLSARAVAEKAGLSHNAVHLMLKGKTVPTLDTAAAICEVLGVSLGQVLNDSQEHGIEECFRRVTQEWKARKK